MKNKPTVTADRILFALLEHGSHEKAAAALGISPTTIWRCLRKPGFQEEYSRARLEAYCGLIVRLQHAANTAMTTLLAIMCDKDAPVASRDQAIDIVLECAAMCVRQDVQVEVDRLKQIPEEHAA